MIAELKPYADYKESGLPWLGQVPGHWGALSVKQEFDIQLGKMLQNTPQTVADLSVPYLKSQHVQWAEVRTSDLPRMWASPRELSQFGVDLGDLLVCEGGEGGRCAVVKSIAPGAIIQNALYRVRPRSNSDNCFLAYAMAAISSVGWFDAINNKATIAHFTRDKFGSLGIPLPPPAEQAAIVPFLDWANGRLERAIRAKRKVIALLNEQKQAIIHRAVTRGLDPSVPLKPSGIPWLGDIPQHWEVRRLKSVASRIVDCLHATPRYLKDGTHPAIRTADIAPGVVHLRRAKRISSADFARWTERLEPISGDILYSREGERFGIAACVPEGVQLCISQRMMVFRLTSENCSHFVMWLLNSRSTYGQALQDVIGATAPHVNISTIRNYYLAMPSAGEQQKIAHHIESETCSIDTAMARLNREIELLREYRTRLVADVVTGKLDVREAAARLPDEAPLESVMEDSDMVDQTEAADEQADE